ncbi:MULTISPECIES: IS91 family transposase [unclassified Agarivorans]|uniref:IS91 family transposase n=1 Tax=unclassified Agarivorans TaxID=2636026 RepID=UPI003D7D65E9
MSTFIDLLHQHEAELAPLLRADAKRAMYAMLRCKTEQQGHSLWQCEHCPHQDQLTLSCGHRHCPQCQHHCTTGWLTRQQHKLLPTTYFMVTFTLPHELRALARVQPKALYQIMFKVVSSLLKDFAKRQNQGELGFTAVLHTHSRQRNLHPHLHVLVAGGRYHRAKQQWHHCNKKYLFNAFALAKVWRGRMLDALNQHPNIKLPPHIPTKWVVDCRNVGFGLPALQYLSRYLYRGILSDNDIISTDNDQVSFRYLDSQSHTTKIRTLPTLRFLRLILAHVLPKGLQRVRDYGFLRGNAKHILRRIQLLLRVPQRVNLAALQTDKHSATRPCPCCQHPMHCTGVSRTS